MPCFVHIGATSTGRGLSSVAQDMTGMIATSLTMDAAGAVASFRQCCVDTLVESMLPPIDAPRYGPDHESVIYLRDLLHLCIPFSDQGMKRANRLMSMLTSDIREPVIQLRILGGVANVGVKTWAWNNALKLLPRSIGLFPRHRWPQSNSTACA